MYTVPFVIKIVDTGKDIDKGQRKEKELGESIFNEHSISDMYNLSQFNFI